ncbi:hypothetical protein [Kitasatospora sp. MMS16-BH015]|uniref:hypothetical protein n=1 Tax=Kitasatospora sp. MMS16-BH015 TaxID=2018025 RepID=UPI00131A56B8|nr:hypothetical protein [Kitasatospora sp. MMS16-BH015]
MDRRRGKDAGVRQSMTWQSASRPQESSQGPSEEPGDYYADHEEYSRQVLGAADFPVFAADPAGEAAPAPEGDGAASGGEPAAECSEALAEYELRNGKLGWVEMRSGDWSSAEGPYVTVRTYRPGIEHVLPLPDLEDVVEDERDRVYEQLEIDEGDGPGSVRALREWITVEGEPRAVQIHEDCRGDAETRPGGCGWTA